MIAFPIGLTVISYLLVMKYVLNNTTKATDIK
ncbi:Uncharacterised protein [Mycobacteroides abscessus subsp. abscessus]|nr:Uncharacterised protein [Mycobacteroides abscessus subsp. abscessus]